MQVKAEHMAKLSRPLCKCLSRPLSNVEAMQVKAEHMAKYGAQISRLNRWKRYTSMERRKKGDCLWSAPFKPLLAPFLSPI